MALKNLALTVLIAVVAAMLAATPARALTLLTEENPPFSFTEKGKVQGSAAEIVLDMAARAGVPATVELLPWDAAYVRAQGQRDACLFGTARLENRERPVPLGRTDRDQPLGCLRQGRLRASDQDCERSSRPTRSARLLATRRTISCARTASTISARCATMRRIRRGSCCRATVRTTSTSGSRGSIRVGRPPGRRKSPTSKSFSLRTSSRSFLPAVRRPTGRIVTKLAEALEGMKADGAFMRITAEYEKRFPR